MKLLILGGTVFVGRHIAEAAVAAGHDVALFNRGKTDPDGLAGTRALHGDRNIDVHLPATEQWDCVIDVSGYVPDQVRISSEGLRGHAAHYLYISTISVYPDTIAAGADEKTQMLEFPLDGDASAPQAYGGNKANCERVLTDIWSDERLTIVRPTIVAGPYDPTDRFTYWVRRVAAGGPTVVPDRLEQPVQIIDGRDLAAFVVARLADSDTGVYNACGPTEPLQLGQLLTTIKTTTGSDATFTGVSESVLDENNANLPFRLSGNRVSDTMFQVSNANALAAGLNLRPLEETIQATREWDEKRGLPPLRVGIDAASEQRILSAAGSVQT